MTTRPKILIGCFSFISIFCVLAISIVFLLNRPYKRVPDISIRNLVTEQQKALQPGWAVDSEDKWEIWNDTDFTRALWAIYINFTYKHGVGRIFEEVHVFYNPLRARITLSPSPGSVYLTKPYIPDDWHYHPKYADYFEIGCNKVSAYTALTTCKVIVRYKEFTFVINTTIADYMTFDDLERFIDTTDRFMGAFIANSKLQPGKREIPSLLSEIK